MEWHFENRPPPALRQSDGNSATKIGCPEKFFSLKQVVGWPAGSGSAVPFTLTHPLGPRVPCRRRRPIKVGCGQRARKGGGLGRNGTAHVDGKLTGESVAAGSCEIQGRHCEIFIHSQNLSGARSL